MGNSFRGFFASYAVPGFALILAAALLGAPAADAASSKTDPKRLERLWKGQWRQFAKSYFMFEGQAFVLLNYDRNDKNSLSFPADRLRKPRFEMSWKEKVGMVYKPKNKSLKPDDADVKYALNVLPRVAPGHFGHIVSARVVDRIDEDTVRVDDIVFIDSEALENDKRASLADLTRQTAAIRQSLNVTAQDINDFLFRYRSMISQIQSEPVLMTGFDQTKSAGPGSIIEGPLHLAIIDRGDGPEAIPMKKIKPGLTEEQFIGMLEARHKSKQGFAMMIVGALDRRLPTMERRIAMQRYLEDYDPTRLAANDPEPVAPRTEPDPTPAASAEAGTTTPVVEADPTPPSTDAEPPAKSEPRKPQPIQTVADAGKPKDKPLPSLDQYFEGFDDEEEDNASIFDFGRD